ncbi:MAG: hypothetical protein ACYC7A_04060 [Thermoanaerobaculia bacterium]
MVDGLVGDNQPAAVCFTSGFERHETAIVQVGRRILDAIRELLDVAHIEAGHFSVEPVVQPASVLLADAATMARPRATGRHLSLEYCVGAGNRRTPVRRRPWSRHRQRHRRSARWNRSH